MKKIIGCFAWLIVILLAIPVGLLLIPILAVWTLADKILRWLY